MLIPLLLNYRLKSYHQNINKNECIYKKFNTKTYYSTNNNYNANFDTYIIGNNNIPVDGIKYYSNKFAQIMASFIVDSGDTILGGNLIVTESATV